VAVRTHNPSRLLLRLPRHGRTATSLRRGENPLPGVDLLLLGAGDRPRHCDRRGEEQ
jgi:hypothetical protein